MDFIDFEVPAKILALKILSAYFVQAATVHLSGQYGC